MQILNATGREDIATVHIADMGGGKLVEFVESTQPPLTRDEKWVLIVSVLFGCPVKCLMCDAGDTFKGKLSKEQMFDQIDYLFVLESETPTPPGAPYDLEDEES